MPVKLLQTLQYLVLVVIASLVTACGGDTKTRTIIQDNEIIVSNYIPIADIDALEAIKEQTDLTLDGTGSSDADGSIASWQWTQVDNGAPGVVIQNATTSIASATMPNISAPTDLIFQLTVTDDKGVTDTALHTVTVTPVFAYIPCSTDDVASMSSSGVYSTGKTGGYIPLCNGELLIANATLNRIDRVDLKTGSIVDYYELTSTPAQMVMDTARGIIYVALPSATFVARLDLNTDTVDYIAIAEQAMKIAVRQANGFLMTTVSSPRKLYWYDVNDVAHGPWDVYGDLIQHNSATDEVLVTRSTSSPARIYRYEFDTNGDLAYLQQSISAGNPNSLAISASGNHLIAAAGGGNGTGYTIFDFNPRNLDTIYGEFNTGAYPVGGHFSLDEQLLATTNRSSAILFTVSNHTESVRYTPSACSYGELTDANISRGNKLMIASQTCGIYDDVTNFYYYKLP